HHVGTATSEGIDINGVRIIRGDMSGSDSARMLLRNPAIDAAVLETSHKGILCSGLGYDRADVAVVTDVSGHHRGLTSIQTLEHITRLSAVVANSTTERGVTVLNADDSWCVQIAGQTTGQVIYFSLNSESEVIKRHLQRGGQAVVLHPESDGEALRLIGSAKISIALSQGVPGEREGSVAGNTADALAAAAACVGLNINCEHISQGLRSFAEGRSI
ncbi:MAG TPA: Mur ligase family protein, partial [Chthoniobacterales bacterium]